MKKFILINRWVHNKVKPEASRELRLLVIDFLLEGVIKEGMLPEYYEQS